MVAVAKPACQVARREVFRAPLVHGDPGHPELPAHIPEEVHAPPAGLQEGDLPGWTGQLHDQARHPGAAPDVEKRRPGPGDRTEQHQGLDEQVPDPEGRRPDSPSGDRSAPSAPAPRDSGGPGSRSSGGARGQAPPPPLVARPRDRQPRRAFGDPPSPLGAAVLPRPPSGGPAALRSIRYCCPIDSTLFTSQ